MKSILILITTITLLQSCQSQSNFDLSDLTLKKEKISDFITKDIKSHTYPNYVSTRSKKLMIFDKLELAGKNPKAHSANSLHFYPNKDNIIIRYTLTILETELSEKLLKKLKEKLTKPNYTGYHTIKDKENDNPNTFIWEDQNNNLLYILDYSEQEYGIESMLNVIINPSNPEDLPALDSLSYWGDFMFERNKRGDDNYTYQQFIKDEKENLNDSYELISK